MDFKIRYDAESDILWLARPGFEDEFVELHPGVNIELDLNGLPIGVEILNASKLLKQVVEALAENARDAEIGLRLNH